eukprot:1878021-Rhodomonas_salina.1
MLRGAAIGRLGSAVTKLASLMQQSRGYGERWLTDIPFVEKHQLMVRFARASGAGGQHVNKTETKVDMRIRLEDVNMPSEVMTIDTVSKLRESIF